MEIDFISKKLGRIFNSDHLLKKEYGEQTRKIKLRMAVLKAASCLAMVPASKPDRRHELTADRKGTFAVDLKHPFRLVFKPSENPVPRREDGGIDLEKVMAITILKVEDYH